MHPKYGTLWLLSLCLVVSCGSGPEDAEERIQCLFASCRETPPVYQEPGYASPSLEELAALTQTGFSLQHDAAAPGERVCTYRERWMFSLHVRVDDTRFYGASFARFNSRPPVGVRLSPIVTAYNGASAATISIIFRKLDVVTGIAILDYRLEKSDGGTLEGTLEGALDTTEYFGCTKAI